MSRDERLLRDIVALSDELARYVEGVSSDDFVLDVMRQRAVERVVTIIGEAAKQLSEETRDAIDQPWREIIRFRDKGIHAYNSLTPTTLLRIAEESVPELRRAIEAHLER